MDTRIAAFVTAALIFMLPLYGLAHEVGSKTQKESAPHEEAVQEEGIEAHIEDVLERKLAPLRAELAEIHAELERPGLAEIMGGIGWIVGILGIMAYIKSRRK